jgi:hypothetical protein
MCGTRIFAGGISVNDPQSLGEKGGDGEEIFQAVDSNLVVDLGCMVFP